MGGNLADALVMALEGSANEVPVRQVLELAGTERVTMTQLLDELERITDRHPQRIPVPEWMALAGTKLAKLAGVALPVNVEQVTMLLEENAIAEGQQNALTEVFGITPTPLSTALELLADAIPERLPREGVGPMLHHRYWTVITNASMTADELFELLRQDFSSLFPRELVDVGVEPGTPVSVEEGVTLTMRVPVRGHIQVRVLEVRHRRITCVTVEGHHLAGVIRYQVREHDDGIRFEVRSFARASQLLDELGMAAVGHRLQEHTWTSLVEEAARRCGSGEPHDVQTMSLELPDERAHRVDAMGRPTGHGAQPGDSS